MQIFAAPLYRNNSGLSGAAGTFAHGGHGNVCGGGRWETM
jgi:hypothetical protein